MNRIAKLSILNCPIELLIQSQYVIFRCANCMRHALGMTHTLSNTSGDNRVFVSDSSRITHSRNTMERHDYIECGGYHWSAYTTDIPRLNKRICLKLCKPVGSSISIREQGKREATEVVTNFAEEKWDSLPIAGTYQGMLKCYTERSTSHDSRGIAFDKRLEISEEDIVSSCDVVRLSSLFPSNNNTNDNGLRTSSEITGPAKTENVAIYCVLQTNTKYKRYNRDQEEAPEQKDSESHLWRRMISLLPVEIVLNVLQYMDYDRVSWLADNDNRFARSLAYHRYNVSDAYSLDRFPDKQSIVRVLRFNNAMEMRFDSGEELWICGNASRTNFPVGTCLCYSIKEGTYTWCKVATTTALKFDSSRCMCVQCIEMLTSLKKAMDENQTETVVQHSRTKVFALKGSGSVPIERKISSVFWKEDNRPIHVHRSVHMWTDDSDYRYLSDLRTEDNRPLTVQAYKRIRRYKTMIFKSPVKFFGVSKIVQSVDRDVVALVSSVDNEVLGYLVMEQEYRFRTQLYDMYKRVIVGLNFVPNCTMRETRVVSEMMSHIHRHDFEYSIGLLIDRKARLKHELTQSPLDRERLLQELSVVRMQIGRLYSDNLGSELRRTGLRRERPNDNILHVHETISGDFEICSRYLCEPLSALAALPNDEHREMKRVFDFMTNDNICTSASCNLHLINREKLECYLAVAMGSTRSIINNIII